MTLGSKVYNAINIVLLEQSVYSLEIADVSLHKCVVWLILYILEICQITRLGELIEVNDVILWILIYEKTYYVATDKTCTACD